MTVRADGFAAQTSPPVAVEVGRTATLNFRSFFGRNLADVVVTALPAMLTLENPNTTTTLEAETIASLPNPGQDLTI